MRSKRRENSEKTKTKIQIIEKKGQKYIKITDIDTKKAKTLRYDEKVPIDIYYLYYKDVQANKYKGTIAKYSEGALKDKKPKREQDKRATTKIKRYIKRTTGKTRIIDAMRRSKSDVTIPDINKATPQEINEKVRTLLRPLVLDKKLLNILSTDHNIQKFKDRLQYEIKFKTKENKAIAVTSHIGQKTPQEVAAEIKKLVPKGESIEDYKQGYSGSVKGRLNSHGYATYRHINNGQVNKTEVKITYRG